MVTYIPPPDPRSLLPPLLACLPTAFVSNRPPPGLLPLLSPILRQRVQILSGDAAGSDSWLSLLSWDAQRASKLPDIVERLQLEPHPVSGEVEVPDVQEIEYRRLDQETLHARILLDQVDLLPIFLWCMGGSDTAAAAAAAASGGGSGAWKLAELRAREDGEDGSQWYSSMTEAEEHAQEGYVRDALNAAEASSSSTTTSSSLQPQNDTPVATAAADDDDAYWAAYDRTPGRTPARTPVKRSPMGVPNVAMPSTSELEYFARYLTEVQPAMDPHDPDGEELAPGESTLRGNELAPALNGPAEAVPSTTTTTTTARELVDSAGTSPLLNHTAGDDGLEQQQQQQQQQQQPPPRREVHSPRPRSPASSTRSVDTLERAAEQQSQAEVGIKQHISTDIKSLFRLARSAGIERDEFERIVKTELQMLEMMDMDE